MNDFIKYNYAAIQAALADINARWNTLIAQGDDVKSRQTQLAQDWVDETSAAAYQAAQDKWNTAYGNIIEILDRVRRAAEDGVVSMAETNSRAAASWA